MRFSPILTVVFLAASTEAVFGSKHPPKPQPHIVNDFIWSNPFNHPSIASYEALCESTATFSAMEYTLEDLMEAPPRGLKPWSTGLKRFFSGREYPGAWAGIDPHGPERKLLKMDYGQVPIEVKRWIEAHKEKGLFAVYEEMVRDDEQAEEVAAILSGKDEALDKDKIMIFAPGALYHVLPLWVTDTAGKCKAQMIDLASYTTRPETGKVIAWLDHGEPEDKQTRFTVKAQVLSEEAIVREEL